MVKARTGWPRNAVGSYSGLARPWLVAHRTIRNGWSWRVNGAEVFAMATILSRLKLPVLQADPCTPVGSPNGT